jgi:hypothetical protein
MTAQFKPVAFDPYRKQRPGWRPPRWLVLLLIGASIGASGVILVQEQLLAPRLSASESASLRTSLEHAERDRERLRADLAATTGKLEATLADNKAVAGELAADRERTKNSRADFDFLVASLPPDPRGGTIEVRAARLTKQRGTLEYEVLLTRAKPGAQPLAGVMQFVVAGVAAAGSERHITLEPIKVSVGSHQSLRGSLALPDSFTPRQTTINLLDRVGGKPLGMRVMYVQP